MPLVTSRVDFGECAPRHVPTNSRLSFLDPDLTIDDLVARGARVINISLAGSTVGSM